MKKKLLILFFITFSGISFAQLTVKNAAFIFANNSLIFVEDDVRLTASNDFIYLRNNSQFIQGSGTTGNSGVGKLSIYQNGNVNQYAYNYWCSPVGNTDIDNISNRNFRANNVIYDETLGPITSSLATYTSSYDGTSNPLVIADYWLFSYNSGTIYNDWVQLKNTGNLAAGYGFTMKGTSGSSSNQLYDFRGKPNNGDISVNIGLNKFTLTGNPYPSALDSHKFIWDANNQTTMTGTLYFWEQDATTNSHYLKEYFGGYATFTIDAAGTVITFTPATFRTYNGDGTINSGGTTATSTSSKRVYRYIPIGQGFLIEGSANGNVFSKNNMRAFKKQSGTTSEFFKIENNSKDKVTTNTNNTATEEEYIIQYNEYGFSIVPDSYRRFRINIDFDNIYTRQLVQTFHHTATDGFDRGLESKSESELKDDAFWILGTDSYVAQAFSFEPELKIPLNVNITNPQTLRFRIFDLQNFDDTPAIYLHDTDTNNYYDLNAQDVELFLEAGTYNERFEITFIDDINSTLAIDEAYAKQLQIFQNNTTAELTILNPNSLDIELFQLYDVRGRLIINKQQFENQTKYTINTNSISAGVYLANIKLTDTDTLITKKIVIHNK